MQGQHWWTCTQHNHHHHIHTELPQPATWCYLHCSPIPHLGPSALAEGPAVWNVLFSPKRFSGSPTERLPEYSLSILSPSRFSALITSYNTFHDFTAVHKFCSMKPAGVLAFGCLEPATALRSDQQTSLSGVNSVTRRRCTKCSYDSSLPSDVRDWQWRCFQVLLAVGTEFPIMPAQ